MNEKPLFSESEDREQMPEILVVSRKADKPKPENEDAEYANSVDGVYVVADGVSRYKYDQDHSPARRASQAAAAELGGALAELVRNGEEISRTAFREAFSRANEAVRQVNQSETFQNENGEATTLWESADFMNRDLAGTVAVAAVKRGNQVDYGYIGDCRMMLISPDGEIVWQALTEETDRVARAQKAFGALRTTLPAKDDPDYASARYRYIRTVHTEYRNNPGASIAEQPHPTYGVLTGQQEAVDEMYLETGSISVAEGESLVLCSDGMEPFLMQDQFRTLLLTSPTPQDVNEYIDAHKETDKLNDDKTLIVVNA